MKSCVELLRSCGINILVVFSDIPVFSLDYKLPTTLNIELVTHLKQIKKKVFNSSWKIYSSAILT